MQEKSADVTKYFIQARLSVNQGVAVVNMADTAMQIRQRKSAACIELEA
jgi:hypothetical protein